MCAQWAILGEKVTGSRRQVTGDGALTADYPDHRPKMTMNAQRATIPSPLVSVPCALFCSWCALFDPLNSCIFRALRTLLQKTPRGVPLRFFEFWTLRLTDSSTFQPFNFATPLLATLAKTRSVTPLSATLPQNTGGGGGWFRASTLSLCHFVTLLLCYSAILSLFNPFIMNTYTPFRSQVSCNEHLRNSGGWGGGTPIILGRFNSSILGLFNLRLFNTLTHVFRPRRLVPLYPRKMTLPNY